MLYHKNWKIEYYDENLQNWVDILPVGIRASFARLSELLIEFGVDLRLPHARKMGAGLFELRPRGKEGIARIFYCALIGKRIMFLHGIRKKTEETPNKELKIARRRLKEVKNES
ncbi:MAG TPA: type II toxin-antitoxin system RelE/ParE family toxin [Coxiellaceae bacterium]|nr:MAG: hypothetical protein A3E81_06530 [Gammaproteobacteria bacterium RIFCSPHIGHO2_12_FULL_36_30]HLB56517.1 type II toxin-antitoxin system RelE/ParE family toxin [Coxiellaceae bacterium]